MKKNKIKAAVALLLVLSLITAGVYYGGSDVSVSKTDSPIEKNSENPENSDQLSIVVLEASVDEVLEASKRDGGEGASLLTTIKDTETYESTLRTILDDYFGNPGNEEKINALSASIDDRGKLIVENYKNADKERKNADKLDYTTGEVLVLFDSGTSESTVEAVAGQTNHEVQSTTDLDMGKLAVMDLPLEYTVEEGSKQLMEEDKVLIAQPNYIYQLMEETPDEPSAEEESAETMTVPNDGTSWYLSDINAPAAWDLLPANNKKVKVAVIDTGARPTHEDLRNVLNVNTSATIEYGVIKKGVISDDNGHGTHVSGIIAAQANNGVGMAGVASGYNPTNKIDNNIVDLFVIDAYDNGFYTSDLLKSIDYAVNNGAKLINMSLGGPGHNSLLDASVKKASESGVLCISAAGNESTDRLVYPADIPEGMAVLNTTSTGSKSLSSNFGRDKDISAPGSGIYSTESSSDAAYGYKSGTSMSSPVATGVAAMVLYAQPGVSTRQLKNILYAGTGQNGFNNDSGYGGIDAEASVTAANGLSAVPPTGVYLNRTTARLAQENTMYLEPMVMPAETNQIGLTWTSSNAAVAKVSQGTVTGVAPGQATITARTINGMTASCVVTVFPRYTTVSSAPYSSTKALTIDSALSTPLSTCVDSYMRYGYGYMNGYKYTGIAGQKVTFAASGTTLSGSEFDTYLTVLDSNGNVVAKNDDVDSGYDSLVTYVLPVSGTYYVQVSEAITGNILQLGNITFTMKMPDTFTSFSPSKRGMTLRDMIVRKTPSTSSTRVGTFKIGTLLKLNGMHTTSEGVKWYKVYTNGQYGYILERDVVLLAASNGYVNFSPSRLGKTTSKMYVRLTLYSGAPKIGTFYSNYTIKLNGMFTTAAGVKWYKVNYNGRYGYIPAQYVRLL